MSEQTGRRGYRRATWMIGVCLCACLIGGIWEISMRIFLESRFLGRAPSPVREIHSPAYAD